MKKKTLEIPAYMRPTLEKHEKEMKKAAQLTALAEKYANSKQSLQHANVISWIFSEILKWEEKNPLPRSLSKNKKFIALQEKFEQNATQVLKLWEQKRNAVLAALEAGDFVTFFELLEACGGTIIFDPRISQAILEKVLSSVWNEKDRAFLVQLPKKLKFVEGRGSMPQLDLEVQHQAKLSATSKSKALTRIMNKREGWLYVFGDPDEANKQTLIDFNDDSKLPNHQKQEVIKEYRKRVARKGNREN